MIQNKKITKKQYIIAGLILGLLAIVGSIINFYTVCILINMIMEIKSPKFMLSVFTYLGGNAFVWEIIIAFIFVLRSLMNPNTFKKRARLYSIIILCISSIGLLCTILSGAIKYHSLIKPYPFAGAHIIALIFHIINIAFCILYLVWLKKFIPEDRDVKKCSALYVLGTIAYILIYYVFFYRVGAFLFFPFYTTWSLFPKLITFYLALLMPLGIMAQGIVYTLGGYKNKRLTCLIVTAALLLVSLGLLLSVVLFELSDPSYIAAISIAMPIERTSTLPVDTVMMLVFIPLSLIAMLVEQGIRYNQTQNLIRMKRTIEQNKK